MIRQSRLTAKPRPRAVRAYAAAFLLQLLLVALPAVAQTTPVLSGSVVDAASGKPVARATVRIVGTPIAATSDTNGRFELRGGTSGTYDIVAQASDARIGVAVNVVTGESSADLTIRVSRDRLLGGDLLTSASFSPVSARLAPYAVDVVTSQDLPVPASVNALASLEGKVSGLAVAKTDGLPGSDVSLLLRSPVTANTLTSPLVVIDGVMLSNLHDRSLQDIDALDIDRIEVIKGAAAASLYGYQGMHGVIVIQTKRGRSNVIGRPQFSVRNEIGYDEAEDFASKSQAHPYRVNAAGQYVNTAGVVVPRSQRVRQANNIAENRYVDPTFDHDAQVFRRALFNTQTVSLSQNLSATNYSLSYSRTRQQSTFLGADGIVRHTARLNLDHHWGRWLGVNISAAHVAGSDALTVANLANLLNFPADVNLLGADPLGTERYIPYPDSTFLALNPLVAQDQSNLDEQRQRTLLNVGFSSRPTSWLTLHAVGSYDRGYQDTRNTRVLFRNEAGLRTERRERFSDSVAFGQFRGGATVSRSFGLLSSQLSIGTTTQRERAETAADDYTVAVGSDGTETIFTRGTVSSVTERRAAAGLANFAASYAGKYVADVAFRRERASLYGRSGWKNFVRGNVAWLLNEEQWLPFRSLDLLKLRFGAGTSETPMYLGGAYTFASVGVQVFDGSEPFTRSEREIGVDIAPNARARATVTYSSARSSSRIAIPRPAVPGYQATLTNAAGVTSGTIEATLDVRALDLANGFHWDIRAVADHRSAKIRSFDRSCFNDDISYLCEGIDLQAMWGSVHVRDKADLPSRHANSGSAFDVNDEGFVVPVGVGNTWRDGKAKNLWGTAVVVDGASYPWGIPMLRRDAQNQTVFSEIGNSNPALRYGLQNSVRFKALRLYALLNGQIGGDVYDAMTARRYASGSHPDIDQSGKADELRKPVGYYQRYSDLYIDSFVKDATHMRLSEASVGVTLDASRMSWMHRIGARRIDVDLVGRNLFTATGYGDGNPQAPSPTNAINGIRYPLARTFTLATAIVF
jgi:TonB-dependent SusC/RagA subfamily outer membrane receptor